MSFCSNFKQQYELLAYLWQGGTITETINLFVFYFFRYMWTAQKILFHGKCRGIITDGPLWVPSDKILQAPPVGVVGPQCATNLDIVPWVDQCREYTTPLWNLKSRSLEDWTQGPLGELSPNPMRAEGDTNHNQTKSYPKSYPDSSLFTCHSRLW